MIRVGPAHELAVYMILNLNLHQITAGTCRFQITQLHEALVLSAVNNIVHLVS